MPNVHVYSTKYGYAAAGGLWKFLRLSAQKCGVEVGGYGGEQVPNYYTMRILDMTAYLESIPDEYVLYCDSRDSLMIYHDAERAIGLLDYYKFPVIVQAERNCFPYPELAKLFPDPGTPWKYLNAGGIFGKRTVIIDILKDAMLSHCGTHMSEEEASDQGLWSYLYTGGTDRFTLDYECRLFQSMYLNNAGDCYVENGRVKNKFFPGAEPQILHFNGNWPGIKDWFKKIHV